MVGLERNAKLLNVACGMGAETLEIHKTYHCEIDGVDLCNKHVAIARKRIADAGVDGNIVRFHNQSATNLSDFKNESFSHVICIEGGPFFMRRIDFIKEAHRVLQPDGRFCIADITLAFDKSKLPYWKILMAKLGAWVWNIPWCNSVTVDTLKEHMEQQGFKDVVYQDISDNVFLGYYEDSWSPETIQGLYKVRGRLYTALGHIVDFFFYYCYHLSVIRYVIVSARK